MKAGGAHHAFALFEEALEQPEAEREAWLDAACPDEALRARVRAMLRADTERDGLFAARPADLAAVMPVEAEPDFRGREIGPYRIEHELGRGGMGAVYLAERPDVGKRVALKLVTGGIADPNRIARFLVERRVLARLDHPGIARLLDAGVTEPAPGEPGGTPYFAMEYVEGEPLDAYCDARNLPIPERLALFEAVCDAVAYAHRNLVVHRDLKPSNILVTPAGDVKLLDFGIARLLEDDADTGLTRTGITPMTPDFAAPEQVLGEPATTATDVYQLGVVLYDLLSGHRPYRLGGKSLGEIERSVVRETPTRLVSAAGRTEEVARADGSVEHVTPKDVASRRGTEPERLRRRLAGELESIVMKALAKEPERRYASAEGLLADLERYRKGHPVVAQPDSRWYRARKFVGRHPVGVGITLGVLALMVGFGAFYTARVTAERDQAEAARARTEIEAEKAARISTFLTDLFVASDPFLGGSAATPVGDFLDLGAASIEDLEDQPEVQAEMLATLGKVFLNLGELDRAQPLLEHALDLRQKRLGDDHPDVALGLNDLGQVLGTRGELDSAIVLHQRAYQIQGRHLTEPHLDLASTQSLLGTSYYREARYTDAEASYRSALDTYEQLLPYPDVMIARAQSNVGLSLHTQGRNGEATTFYRAAIETFEALPRQHQASLARVYNNLANVLREERPTEAESLYRQALQAKRATLPAGHPSIGVSMTNLGNVLLDQGKVEEAEPFFREALALQRAALGPHHRYVVNALNGLAGVALERQDYDVAESRYAEALDLTRETFRSGHPRRATALMSVGQVQLARDRPARAEALLRDALAVRVAAFGAQDERVADVQRMLGETLVRLARFEEAEPLLLQSLATLDAECQAPGCSEPTLRWLVALYEAWGKPEQAESYDSRLIAAAAQRADG